MPYPFLGTSARWYTQYLDATGKTLQAEPGGVYDMAPAAGAEGMPVPPPDGLWGPEQGAPKAAAKDKAVPQGRAANGATAAPKGD